jgi:Predicted metal-binding integral membrane protein (DUF2182)
LGRGMLTRRTPEGLRREAQRLVIEADEAQELGKRYLGRAAAVAGKADLIERGALNEAAPKNESAQSSSSPSYGAPFWRGKTWIRLARVHLGADPQRMPGRAGLKQSRSGVAGPESTSLLANTARLFLPRSPRGWGRAIVLMPLVVLTAIAWLVTAYQAQNMNAPTMSAGMEMPASSMVSPPMGGAVAFLAIWFVMMAAMMLPSVAPTLLTFANLESRRRGKNPLVSTWLFAGGYLVVWGLVGVVAYFVLWASASLASDLARPGTESPWRASPSPSS